MTIRNMAGLPQVRRNHLYDDGNHCGSAAVTGRDYCCYHLRYRGRLMRMAQARARGQHFHLDLPPLENMHAVQSALTQVVEALAADMIDPKRAQLILSALRMAANNFKNPAAWKPSVYLNNHSATHLSKYDEFEADFGLPDDIDIEVAPEVAFPPPAPVATAAPFQLPDPDGSVANGPITPEHVELVELGQTVGNEAMLKRAAQHVHNANRREQRQKARADYERYSAIARTRNLQIAAQKLVAEKLAAEKAVAQTAPADASAAKKPPTSAVDGTPATQKEAKKTA